MANRIERRDFLKVLGVSGAGVATACGPGQPAETLLPYVIPNEEIVPGIATWYRSTCQECSAGCGISVKTREGRAIKIEGNALSPISHGKVCSRGHAALHGVYNPDRVPQALTRAAATDAWQPVTWDEAEEQLAQALAQNRGRAVFLSDATTGTIDRLIDEFCAAFGIQRVRYAPFAWEPLRAANRLVFGRDVLPVHDFAAAETVISFGADFLETWVSPVDYAHGFVRGHAYDRGQRGHFISVAPHQSLTDMNSDEWVPVTPGTEHLVAIAIARILMDDGRDAGGAAALLASVNVEANAQAAGVSTERLRQMATHFDRAGASLAVGPGVASTHRAATQLAAAVAVLNAVAGNLGRTVRFTTIEQSASGLGTYSDMQALLQRMTAGEVGALLVHGPNPLYSMPESQAVSAALDAVGFVASFSSYLDETSARARLLLPDHHFLESWGDAHPRSTVAAVVQPVMMPVFNTKQTGDVLLSAARRVGTPLSATATTYHDYLRDRWRREIYPAAGAAAPFDDWWHETLQVGFVATAAAPAPPPAVTPAGLAQIPMDAAPASFDGDAADPVLVVYPSAKFYDGRMANRPWLQELPDAVTKYTWGSCVELSPELADELGVDDGHVVTVETAQGSVEAQAFRHPGMRRDVVALQLGQGHEGFGTYAENRGVNAVRLLAPVADAASGGLVWTQTRARVRPQGDWQRPAQSGLFTTQRGRGIAQAETLAAAVEADRSRGLPILGAVAATEAEHAEGEEEHGGGHPMDAHQTQLSESGGFRPIDVDASPAGYPPPGTHYGEYSETQPRWAMSVDLERCIGCSACQIACQAENNIGIVGPKLVAQGRQIQWIRIERYFEGEGETLQSRFLPMMCQHCGNAPCEPVCPVYAAYHTPDGLNAQVYNRCVGTRYCANNCPYKVRYFNYFSYEWPEPLNWQLNPDVTVREKGVMEKCTFCVQRIRDAENTARLEGRGVRDGEITTACAQTCPGEAIVFGNIRDPNSRVARVAASGRGYRVLDMLNTQSAVIYLRKISEHATETAGEH